MFSKAAKAFSLAEILITLVIMGLMAAFTLPKILSPSSQMNGQFNTRANDAAVMLMAAFQTMKNKGIITSTTSATQLTPYLNYVSMDTSASGSTDNVQGYAGGLGCVSNYCINLHNGGRMRLQIDTFNGTASTNAITVIFDPDSTVDATTNGPAKSIRFFIYYDGRVKTWGTINSGTVTSSATWNPQSSYEPPWFSWQ